ncbi:MAG: SDR family NAD(P)-dependent oxidoreductase [bacterium]|nr:oxidoreductase [Deltaproteobacteria bacterium]MCP4906481.1 SDR family NAD(P)-dependent oxidoreductase [bacterium]
MSSQDLSLAGRVALVTGASRGIGRAIARRLAKAGARVGVTARSLDLADDYAGTLIETVELIERAGGKAFSLKADLGEPAERDTLIHRTVAEAGRLDILVNAAGFAQYATVETMPDDFFEASVDHYLRAPFKLAQAAIPIMRRQGEGWIVNVGSVTAERPARPYDDFARFGGATIYAAMKAALSRYTQGLAAELESEGIAVNQIAPTSAISTPGADRYIPKGYPTEPVEYLAEAALALCHLPAKERTGLITYSLEYPLELGLDALDLETGEILPPPQIPAYSHPDIRPRGE